MCPGGLVVAASNQAGRVVLNGMSFSGRSSRWANAAIIADVEPADYPGSDPLAGVRFQEAIEERAYEAAGGNFRAPAQRADDFVANRASRELPRSSYALGVTAVELRALFPSFVAEAIRLAVLRFDATLGGLAGPETLVLAPESRTTSPIRLVRGSDRVALGLADLYPVGEGAGYAGGIVSAALDGVFAASAILQSCGS